MAIVQARIRVTINVWRSLIQYIKNIAPIEFLGDMMDWVSKKFESAVKYCKGLWVKFLNWLGVSSKKIDKASTYVPEKKP